MKNIKKEYNSLKTKILVGAGTLLTGTSSFAKNNILNTNQNDVEENKNFIVTVITGNHLVAMTVKSALIGGVLYAVFNMGKQLIGGQGQTGDIWKNIGGIIFLGAVYYLLFM